MVKILALCHGKKLDNPPGTKCFTSLININHATFIDKDISIKPHILQDLKQPFITKIKYDIITTVCCNTDVFYNDKSKSIEKQTFKNIKLALKENGIFIFPKYNWLNTKILKEIQNYFKLVKKFITNYETFYIFKNENI
jgi:hypothetical protein